MSKKYFKKTLAGIFAVVLVASSIPLVPYTEALDSISITASAAETEDGFIYAANADGTVTITGYNGTGGDVVIPSTIDGSAVTAIGTKAFYQCDGINSITVPEGVLSIGTAQDEFGVFEECSMQSISLPSTLLYIWPYAFASTQLTEITFPDSVIRIGDAVFLGCTELKSITAPCRTAAKEELWKPQDCSPEITYSHVYEAGADVCVCGKTSYFEFDSAAGIISGYNGTNTSVKVPEKIDGIAVTAIADDAFSDCDFIETISAPCAISGEWSKNCKAAVSHYNHVYAKGAAECNCGEASVYAYEENEDGTITLTRYFGGDSEVVVPAKLFGKTVSKVKGAFWYNGNITKVVISEGITCIDDSLFQGCGNLKEVVLPLSLKTIGMYVFCDCTGLESITIPENVETIGIQAFQYCSNLKEIHMLGKTPPETHWTAFYTECNSVESIYVPYGTEDDYAAFPLLFPREDVSEVPTIIHPSYPSATYVLGGKGENFTNSADSDMMLTEPEKPLADGYAFAGWYTDDTFTTKFDFTKGIDDDIKIYAKWEETATVTFDMQGNGTQIAPVSIVNGNTITEPEKPSVDGYDFGGWYTDKDCTDGNLFDFSTQITDDITLYAKWSKSRNAILDSELTWQLDNGVLTISGLDEAFPECWVNNEQVKWCDEIENVKKVVFNTPNLKNLGSGAFLGCENLESIELPNSLTTIGDLAFEGCTNLTGIDFPENLTTIGASAFYGCTKLESIVLPNSVTTLGECVFGYCDALSSVKLSENITSLPEAAFVFTNIESFEIPAGITEIGAGVFIGCMNMKEINVAADNSAYCSVDGVLFDKEKETLMQYPTGKTDSSYIVQDTVTSIQEAAFACNTSLTDITLPSNLTKIECETFGGSGLTSITIPDSVTSIGISAFEDCEDLTSVMIPNSVTEIEHSAFRDCSSLTRVTIPASVSAIGQGAFQNTGLKSVTFECDDAVAIANFNSEGVYDIFEESVNLETIYVPAGCVDAYKNSEGYQAALGDYIDLIQEMPIAEAKGYSVSYDGNVTINFHYLLSKNFQTGYVEFSDGTQVSASDAVKDANGYCVFPISMPAKNMYDEITAQFYDENEVAVGDAVTFDLETYMDKVKAYDPNYSDFVDSFLEYGKQAAAYFGNTNAPASTKTYDYTSIISALETNGYDVLPDMGSNYVGATMLLKSTPILRLYYKKAVDGLDLGDNAQWDTNDMNPDLTFIQKTISVTDFATTFNGYSVYHYLYKALKAGDDQKLMKLCAALYDFSKAANAMNQ